MASRAGAKVTTDHNEIRQWAKERGARPSCVRGTGDEGDIGILRLDFPGYSGADSLEEISWDDWFNEFDESGLALLHQDSTVRGQKSNFNKLIARETAEARSQGDNKASAHRRRSRNASSASRSAGQSRSGQSRRSAGTRSTTASSRKRRSSGSRSQSSSAFRSQGEDRRHEQRRSGNDRRSSSSGSASSSSRRSSRSDSSSRSASASMTTFGNITFAEHAIPLAPLECAVPVGFLSFPFRCESAEFAFTALRRAPCGSEAHPWQFAQPSHVERSWAEAEPWQPSAGRVMNVADELLKSIAPHSPDRVVWSAEEPKPPQPPQQTPNSPVREPDDAPTEQPHSPVREPDSGGPKKWG